MLPPQVANRVFVLLFVIHIATVCHGNVSYHAPFHSVADQAIIQLAHYGSNLFLVLVAPEYITYVVKMNGYYKEKHFVRGQGDRLSFTININGEFSSPTNNCRDVVGSMVCQPTIAMCRRSSIDLRMHFLVEMPVNLLETTIVICPFLREGRVLLRIFAKKLDKRGVFVR